MIMPAGFNCGFEFDKRTELFVGMHNKAPSVVAMRVNNPDRSPSESSADTQPQLQPALLRFSMMISQYFTVAFPHRVFEIADRGVADRTSDRAGAAQE
jgi:hypothetical protein